MSSSDETVPSKIAFRKHPLHPMAVVFPVAFLLTAPLTDLAFWFFGDPFWALASFWLTVAGFVMGVVAALLGLAEFILIKAIRTRLDSWTHMLAAVMALALAAANAQLRVNDPVGAVLPWGVLLSTVMALMVCVTGWIGGTLTFKHGIGIFVHERAARLNSAHDESTKP